MERYVPFWGFVTPLQRLALTEIAPQSLTSMVGGPVAYVQGLGLKATGAACRRFTNSPITRDQDEPSCGDVPQALVLGRSRLSRLIRCPVCRGKVSSAAENCPHCGHPVEKEKPKKTDTTGCLAVVLFIAAVVYWVVPWGSGDKQENVGAKSVAISPKKPAKNASYIDPYELDVNSTYVVIRDKLPIMPGTRPDKPLDAISKVKYAQKGSKIKIIDMRLIDSITWYKVDVHEKGKLLIGGGWLNADAMLSPMDAPKVKLQK